MPPLIDGKKETKIPTTSAMLKETTVTSRPAKALIIIDMQNDFVLPGAPACVAGALATLPQISSLLAWFRQQQQPVFHLVREYRADGTDVERFRYDRFAAGNGYLLPGTRGCEIVESLRPTADEYRIVKPRFSAFMQTKLQLILQRLEITELVVCGTQYPNCIRATVLDAVSLDYDVTLVTDATSAETAEIAAANVVDMKNIGVTCVTSEEFTG